MMKILLILRRMANEKELYAIKNLFQGSGLKKKLNTNVKNVYNIR